MIRPFYVHESWHTSWYWRLGRIGLSIYKPAYRHWHDWYWLFSDTDGGGYGVFTPLFTLSWLPKEGP